jgi:hypothetical protein
LRRKQGNKTRKQNRKMSKVARDLFLPAHRIEMVKRMPLFAFPNVWNNALGNKNNRKLKNLLLLNL